SFNILRKRCLLTFNISPFGGDKREGAGVENYFFNSLLFVVEIEAVLVLVIAEQLGIEPPSNHRGKLTLGLFARQQHREMFQHDFPGKRLVLLTAKKSDEIAEEAVFLQLLTQDQLAFVDLRFEKLFPERLEHRVAGRS